MQLPVRWNRILQERTSQCALKLASGFLLKRVWMETNLHFRPSSKSCQSRQDSIAEASKLVDNALEEANIVCLAYFLVRAKSVRNCCHNVVDANELSPISVQSFGQLFTIHPACGFKSLHLLIRH